MPTYKYTLKDGRTLWYAAFNYTDWTGKYCHTCKRGVPKFLYDDICDYISRLGGIRHDDRIFYFKKTALQKEIKAGARKTGLPLIRVHDLRHSHASLLINMGVGILEISERLGHESVKTTLDTYSHLYPEKETQLIDKLNGLERPNGPGDA